MTVATAVPFKQGFSSQLPWELCSCLHLQQSEGGDATEKEQGH